jgi:hypothetical protein
MVKTKVAGTYRTKEKAEERAKGLRNLGFTNIKIRKVKYGWRLRYSR